MESLDLKLFSFRFASLETEKAFLKIHQNPKQSRYIFLAGVFFYISYLILDYILFSEYFGTLVFIRVGCFLPVNIFFFCITYSKVFHRIATFVYIGMFITASAGIIAIIYIVRDSQYAFLYFFGIAQILMFLYGAGKVPIVPGGISGFVVIVSAVAIDSVLIESDPRIIFTKALFMFTIGIIGIIICSIIQYNVRVSYSRSLEIEKLSVTDSLTGLRNRHFYYTLVEDDLLYYINKPPSPEQKGFERTEDLIENRFRAVFLLDIDFFKKINDTYGHGVGDSVLQEFSRRISGMIRANDIFIRWGGEEFLLILKNIYADYAGTFAALIKKGISESPFEIDSMSIPVSVSGGVILLRPGTAELMQSTDIILDLADEALYKAKNGGRNRYVRIDPSILHSTCKKTFTTIVS